MKLPTVAGIQARMGSTRLPGKVMMDVAGKPMLRHVVDRARRARRVDAVYVLTTQTSKDDVIADYCGRNKIPFLRGSEQDVLSRYINLATKHDAEWIVRITSDCPLIEPSFIDYQIERLQAEEADLVLLPDSVSGTLGGQGVMSRYALEKAADTHDALNAEHVGVFLFAEKPELFRHVWIDPNPVYSAVRGLRLCVDEERDLRLMRWIYTEFTDLLSGPFKTAGVIKWLEQHPEIRRINQEVEDSEDNRAVRRLKRKK